MKRQKKENQSIFRELIEPNPDNPPKQEKLNKCNPLTDSTKIAEIRIKQQMKKKRK